jgi:hypothetical protein
LLSFRLGLDRTEAADNTDFSDDVLARVTQPDVTYITLRLTLGLAFDVA